eukprot:TRINITY_DN5893_c0_g1_i1.p1 TRINITY_DN5893_c0_g1~~TRINITY_DN5893_c0_g1_i1.p1  ORF type:complete len:479 (-),score=121.39 TRINITY_DN5893_c0_g1_i1:67-1503(-)
MSWNRPSVTGPAPTARCAHTTCACGDDAGSFKLLIFGGWNGTRMLNDLHILYTERMTWSRPITTGSTPGQRAGHTMTSVGTKLFIFGGGDGYHYLNDLHLLDTETMAWSQAYVTGTSPAARSRHTATLIGNKIYVFGGGDDSRVYNDLYIFDTETMSWSRPPTKGDPPVARWGHTTTLIDDDKLLVFGGHDGNKMLNDIFELEVSTLTWNAVQQKPASAGPDGVVPIPACATPRAGHTATYFGKRVLIFGGGDGVKILNDAWFWDPSTSQWSVVNIGGTAPPSRCAHTSTVLENKLIIFGGGDGGRRFKDLYTLDLDQVLKSEEKRIKNAKKAIKQRKNHLEKSKSADGEKPKDISTFLSSLGMKKYLEKFVEQEIDMDTLPYLTENHLERLGVPTLGARLRVLAAIQNLKEEKQTDMNEFSQTLKESVESLTLSTNRLADLVKNAQQQVHIEKQNKIHPSTTNVAAPVAQRQNHIKL